MAHGLTLGSLFDGSGGFPLAGLLSGIRPVWASEIEPFPIRVTTKRLPDMKHYGDVSKISGADVEPVDIITFGSPCVDLSVAGKREGIEQGQRSSLFFEAIRIIKEMRGATIGRYPTFIVWENVPGALSSGGGQDFRRVLEEVCGIKEADVSIPRPAKWSNAGEIVGDGFSVAWRMLDAQYWGVPQRRKRIYLVGDFAGERAGKILFESEGVRGYSPQSLKAWQRASGDTETGVRAASEGINGNIAGTLDGHYYLGCGNRGGREKEVVAQPVIAFDRAACNQGGMAVVALEGNGARPSHKGSGYSEDNVSFTLNATEQHGVAYSADDAKVYDARGNGDGETACTITGDHNGRITDYTTICKQGYIVRRLAPTECARLQGFPDWWCADLDTPDPTEDDIAYWSEVFETHRKVVNPDGKPKTKKQIVKWLQCPHTDSAEYKMWGNGVALPCVCYIMQGIASIMNEEVYHV